MSRRQELLKFYLAYFFHRLWIFLRYYFNRAERKPVFILCTARTGSVFLTSCFQSVPEISTLREVLSPVRSFGVLGRTATPESVRRHLCYSINASEKERCVLKLMHRHVESAGISLEKLLQNLEKDFPSAKLIIIYRRSLADQYLSLKLAEATGDWVWKEKPAQPPSLVIDPIEYRKYCESTRAFYETLLKNAWIRKNAVVLSYEELAQDPQGVFDRTLFPFLELPPCTVAVSTHKQNVKRPEEIIQNYAEVEALLNNQASFQHYTLLPT